MKIATIVGARPQFIKAATLSRVIAQQPHGEVEERLIHTGQHYDANMSEIFFQEMELPAPHYHLGIGSGTHGAMTGKMLEAIEGVLLNEKPDWVLIYGDTNSTLAGALAAAKLHIPVAHVEAGLRSFNRTMPEEINRIVADHCADILFTPTSGATEQLKKEGVADHKIVQVGDVMYEAALHYQQKAYRESKILESNRLFPKKYVLATIHRAENTDHPERLKAIIDGFAQISREIPVIWPLHPRTRQVMEKSGLFAVASQSIQFIPPVGYLDMLNLETHAQMILTDSGGVQKEAYFFHVPCLTLRGETEWTELVTHGFNTLIPLNKIFDAYKKASTTNPNWAIPLYGEGNAAAQILKHLVNKS